MRRRAWCSVVAGLAGAWLTLAFASDQPTDSAQTAVPSGIRVNPKFYTPAPETREESLRLLGADARTPVPVPTFSGDRPVVALASAIGGQLSVVLAKEQVGSHMDPYRRHALLMPDQTLDAIVLRGMDRTVSRMSPGSERVFMRLNPALLDDVPPAEREQVAMQKLLAEIRDWPQRHQWQRIYVVVPHFRGFERNGLGSKLFGIGLYVQDLQNSSDFEVTEPDGTPGVKRRSRFVALYYYAAMVVLDAKTLAVLDVQPWLIDEKIHDSKSDAVRMEASIDPQMFAMRLEKFAEAASTTALSRTLGGRVEPGELRPVPRETQ